MIDIQHLAIQVAAHSTRPLIGLKWAQTLDGQLADDTGTSKWISGTEELQYTHGLRAQFDAVLVGASTFLADFSKLTVRRRPLREGERQPVRVIFDPREKVLAQVRLGNTAVLAALRDMEDRPTVILTTSKEMEIERGRVYAVPFAQVTSEGLRKLGEFTLKTFGRRLNSVMVEGGPTTLKLFLNAGLVDVACVGIAPILTGGLSNRIQLMQSLDRAHRMSHHSTQSHGQDTVIEMIHESLLV